jgi:hypothetical protein
MNDSCLGLARQLATHVEGNPVEIGVLNFVYEDTDLMSPFSSLLREELERALAQTGRFKIITRSRLADLQIEKKFQAQRMADPGVGASGFKIEEVKALVRGRFYYKYPSVTVFAELAWLDGGRIDKGRIVLPAGEIGARIWPGAPERKEEPSVTTVVTPPRLDASRANVRDVENQLKKVPQDFQIQLVVNEGKRDFTEGETMSYRVQSKTGCHVAIFCHQSDGSTVVLFPNKFQDNTWLPADTTLNIPNVGKDRFQFRVKEPFGADVVQLIACTKASSLHEMVRQYAAELPQGDGAWKIDRIKVIERLKKALAEKFGGEPPRWSEAHVVVCSYPKLGSRETKK